MKIKKWTATIAVLGLAIAACGGDDDASEPAHDTGAEATAEDTGGEATAAEDTGVIAELDEWVLRRAGRDLRRLRQKFGSRLLANVNISGRHLAQPGFSERLQDTMAELGLLPGDVVLELTEGAMVPDASDQGTPVAELCAAGHSIAIDDFGTGYSCLAYLHRLAADYVKIDRAFVSRLECDAMTIACIHSLATGLGMRTIGEGVETREQAERLLEQGIVLQQGFLHGHPVPLRQLLDEGPASG